MGDDTFALCFKALHIKSAREMQLAPTDWFEGFQSVLFVFGIQLLLLFVVGSIVFSNGWAITMPDHVGSLFVRFACCILMHF